MFFHKYIMLQLLSEQYSISLDIFEIFSRNNLPLKKFNNTIIFELCILPIIENYICIHDHQFGFKEAHATDMCTYTV